MSEDYHHRRRAIFTFPNGFDSSSLTLNEEERRQPQQIQQDKLRLQRFEPDDPLVGICQADDAGCLLTYETEVFNLGDRLGSNELLEQRLPSSCRNSRLAAAGFPSEWYVSWQSRPQIASINTDSAKAMQLFLTNPQPRSPSPPSSPRAVSTSTLNMLLRNPLGFHPIGSESTNLVGGDFSSSVIAPAQFARVPGTFHDSGAACRAIGGVVEGQGLSLSLSSSLAQLEAAKGEELRNMGLYQNSRHQVHLVNVLKNSKYAKPAQELLEECCSVGRGHSKKTKFSMHNDSQKPSSSKAPNGGAGCGAAAGSSSSTKDPPPLSAADRMEHQIRKVKLLSMLDEVDGRYNDYCEQMQTVLISFDYVMGFGAALRYTALAQKAMSWHFRCLRRGIEAQLKHSCELLGEKDAAGASRLTKGETPRLKLLDQRFRQQRAFREMGMMDQKATWRSQRGLPDRSVNVLRSWLFDHFPSPYPSDADKQLLARQTGLSRHQVSNWFINARVRLWKPMVEEMYQQEAREEEESRRRSDRQSQGNQTIGSSRNITAAQTPTPLPPPPPVLPPAAAATASSAYSSATATTAAAADTAKPTTKRTHFSASDRQYRSASENQAKQLQQQPPLSLAPPSYPAVPQGFPADMHHYRSPDTAVDRDIGNAATADKIVAGSNAAASRQTRFGTIAAGDVSLTLGLRHAGNAPEKSAFSNGDFGSGQLFPKNYWQGP